MENLQTLISCSHKCKIYRRDFRHCERLEWKGIPELIAKLWAVVGVWLKDISTYVEVKDPGQQNDSENMIEVSG